MLGARIQAGKSNSAQAEMALEVKAFSDALKCLEPSGFDGVHELLVVLLVLIGVRE
jgi:hypothetical protein